MTLSITTIAPTTDLTTRARVEVEIGTVAVGEQALVDNLIRMASAAIVSYCHRPFGREVLTELLPGFGEIQLQLARTPIVTVSVVSFDGQVVTDYSIGDRDRGWLYRRAGWSWTVQAFPGLSGGGSLWDIGSPLPRQEEPLYSVAYVAGYILPPQYIAGATTVSAAAADNSFNDSASGFPALLKAGDVVVASGFTNAANNGRFLVTGTPTTAKIQVSASLVLEGAGAARSLAFDPPAECRPISDLEKAAIETVKSWKFAATTDPAVVERQLGPARERFSEQQGQKQLGLPGSVVGLLAPWVRAA